MAFVLNACSPGRRASRFNAIDSCISRCMHQARHSPLILHYLKYLPFLARCLLVCREAGRG